MGRLQRGRRKLNMILCDERMLPNLVSARGTRFDETHDSDHSCPTYYAERGI